MENTSFHLQSFDIEEPITECTTEDVKPPTVDEINALRQSAIDSGYQEGFEQGTQAATKAVEDSLRPQLNACIEQCQDLLQQLKNPLQHLTQKTESELVLLCISIAESMVYHEFKHNQTLLIQNISKAIDLLPIKEQHIHIEVHPDNIDWLKKNLHAEHVSIHSTTHLTKTDYKIFTKSNQIEYNLRQQIDTLTTTLLGESKPIESTDD